VVDDLHPDVDHKVAQALRRSDTESQAQQGRVPKDVVIPSCEITQNYHEGPVPRDFWDAMEEKLLRPHVQGSDRFCYVFDPRTRASTQVCVVELTGKSFWHRG